jgi:hypothetical protein
MATIPSTTRFIGISPTVNLKERKSALLNAETQPYTMQDIVDTSSSFGCFKDTTQQNSEGITSANLVTINTTSISSGVSIVSGSRITFENPGKYLINFLGQFFFSGGSSNLNITIWYAKNGVIVEDSAFTFTTSSAQNDQVLGDLEDVISVNANDYIQLYWWAGSTGVSLKPTAAGTSPTRPASASLNFNTWKIG